VAKLTRREVLKRGAAVGGTLVWAAPVVQSLGVRPAWAVYRQDISIICLNLLCQDHGPVFVKIQCNRGMCRIEENADKCNPHCSFTPVDGDGDGDEAIPGNPDPNTGCVIVTIAANCEITGSVVKAGQRCCPGPATGTGDVEFCPPTC
jgi:hypothetical protein